MNGSTITLAQGRVAITKDLALYWSGPGHITVVNPNGRVFEVSPAVHFNLGGLSLQGNLAGTPGVPGNPDGGPGGSAEGGCIWAGNQSFLIVTNCYFQGCSASGGAGGDAASQFGGPPSHGGQGASGSGGAIYSLGSVSLACCTFANNFTRGGNGGAGGTGFNGGPGGAAGAAYGGAVWMPYNGVLTVVNCTFFGNHADGGYGGNGGNATGGVVGQFPANGGAAGQGNDAYGGAIYFGQGCDPGSCDGVIHCTVSGNFSQAGSGGTGGTGIWGGNAGMNGPSGHSVGGGFYIPNAIPIGNTIVAGNHAYPVSIGVGHDVSSPGPVFSTSFNLIGAYDGSSGWSAVDDLVGTVANRLDAHLGPLQNNGGEMPTMKPLAGSPAIDAGTQGGSWMTDQLGQTRPVNVTGIIVAPPRNASDIGAFELQSAPTNSPVIITLSPTTAGLTISWPAPSTGFVLQESSDIDLSGWADSTEPVIVVGTQNQVIIAPVLSRRFYRLIQR